MADEPHYFHKETTWMPPERGDQWTFPGRKTKRIDMIAKFYASLDITEFPFDSHELRIELVSDSIEKMTFGKLGDRTTLHT